MAIHSSTLAWKTARTEEPGEPQSMGSQESDVAEQLHFAYMCVSAYTYTIYTYMLVDVRLHN